MQKLELEAEIIQVSIYMNIVLNILKKHGKLSVNKILLFSYLVKKEKFRLGKVYAANNTQDIVCKAISLLSGEDEEYCGNVRFILKAIHLLIIAQKIELNDSFLSLTDEQSVEENIYQESPFLEKAIEESKTMSERQFMKEVTFNV